MHGKKRTPYEVIDVEATASPVEIKKAFHKLAKKLHPDVAGAAATSDFQEASRCYALLMDVQRRADYDATGNEEEPQMLRHVSMLLTSFEKALLDFIHEKTTDIPAAIRAELVGMIQTLKQRRAGMEKHRRRLEALRGKITRKGGGRQLDGRARRGNCRGDCPGPAEARSGSNRFRKGARAIAELSISAERNRAAAWLELQNQYGRVHASLIL